LLQQVRQTVLDGFEHLTLPFDELVRELHPVRDASRAPLFQIMFTFNNSASDEVGAARTGRSGLRIEHEAVETGIARFDLNLTFEQTKNGIDGAVEYDADLFLPDTIERFVGHLAILLAAVAADP